MQSDLKRGQDGEREFIRGTGDRYVHLGGRFHDLYCNKMGLLCELKTDSYDMEETPNFFFERWSDIAKKKPGGAHQALLKGAQVFIYFFIKNGVYFVFDTKKLVSAIDRLSADMPIMRIPNRGWVSAGYLVKRKLLGHLFEECKISKRRK